MFQVSVWSTIITAPLSLVFCHCLSVRLGVLMMFISGPSTCSQRRAACVFPLKCAPGTWAFLLIWRLSWTVALSLTHLLRPVWLKKLGLRGGEVGLAAPQLDISKHDLPLFWCPIKMLMVTPPKKPIAKPCTGKRLSPFCSRCGSWRQGRLSLYEHRRPGYVVHARVTVEYFTKDGKKTSNSKATTPSLFNMKSTTPTTMFYDRISPNNPFEIKEGLLMLEWGKCQNTNLGNSR